VTSRAPRPFRFERGKQRNARGTIREKIDDRFLSIAKNHSAPPRRAPHQLLRRASSRQAAARGAPTTDRRALPHAPRQFAVRVAGGDRSAASAASLPPVFNAGDAARTIERDSERHPRDPPLKLGRVHVTSTSGSFVRWCSAGAAPDKFDEIRERSGAFDEILRCPPGAQRNESDAGVQV
jgi:hypothetical protein